MKRPLQNIRPIGPLFVASEEPDIERRLRDLGIQRIRVDQHRNSNFTSISFFMLGQDPEDMFGSSIEINNNGGLITAQLRAPTFTSIPDQQGLDAEEYENVVQSATLDLWENISADILKIIDEETELDYVVFDDGEPYATSNKDINVRTQDGHKFTNITPHIEFLSQDMDMVADDSKISFEGLFSVIDGINDLFLNKYSDIQFVPRDRAAGV